MNALVKAFFCLFLSVLLLSVTLAIAVGAFRAIVNPAPIPSSAPQIDSKRLSPSTLPDSLTLDPSVPVGANHSLTYEGVLERATAQGYPPLDTGGCFEDALLISVWNGDMHTPRVCISLDDVVASD